MLDISKFGNYDLIKQVFIMNVTMVIINQCVYLPYISISALKEYNFDNYPISK